MQIQNVFAAIGGTSDTELPPQVGSDGESGFAAFVDARSQRTPRHSEKSNTPNEISEKYASAEPGGAAVLLGGETSRRAGGRLSESADATGDSISPNQGDGRDLSQATSGGRGESLPVQPPQNASVLTMAQSLFQTAGNTVQGPDVETTTLVQAAQAGEYITPEDMAALSVTPEVLAALNQVAQPVMPQAGPVEALLGTAADQVVSSGTSAAVAAQAGVLAAAETGLGLAAVTNPANIILGQAKDQANLNRFQTADPAPLSPPRETSAQSAVQLAVETVMGAQNQTRDPGLPVSDEPVQSWTAPQSQPQTGFPSAGLPSSAPDSLPANLSAGPVQTTFAALAQVPSETGAAPVQNAPDAGTVPENSLTGTAERNSGFAPNPGNTDAMAQVRTLPDSQLGTAPLRAETPPVSVAQVSQAATQIAIPVQNQGKTPADVLRPGARAAESEQRPPNRRSVDAAGTPAPENPASPATPVKAGAPLTASALKPVQTAQAGPILTDPQPALSGAGSPAPTGGQSFDIRDPEAVSAAPAGTGEASAQARAVAQAQTLAQSESVSLAEFALDAAPDIVAAEISTEMSSTRVETSAQLLQQRTELPARIAAQLAQAAQTMPDAPVELALSPEELGNVRLTFNTSDRAINVVVAAERGETLDLMRRNIDTLAAEFREMGFQDVSFSFSQQGEQGFEDGTPGQSGSQNQASSEQQNSSADTVDPVRIALDGSGGVDLRL
jgi:flagellar hook-length control protein FliK